MGHPPQEATPEAATPEAAMTHPLFMILLGMAVGAACFGAGVWLST
jgi:hypothetical protein